MFKRKQKEKQQIKVENIELESVNKNTPNIQEIESTVDNSFFYTNDKFFELMDSTMILNTLIEKYPGFKATNTDTEIKHEFLNMIQNKVFVQQILVYYNLTLNEFIKIICKYYPTIFKGIFLKKIKNILIEYDK